MADPPKTPAPAQPAANPDPISAQAFATQLLVRLGFSNATGAGNHARWIVAWILKEGPNAAYNNPLNIGPPTTRPEFRFPDLVAGLDRTVATIQGNERYRAIVSALKRDDWKGAADALQRSGWCGGPGAPCPGYGAAVMTIFTSFVYPPETASRQYGDRSSRPVGFATQVAWGKGQDAGAAVEIGDELVDKLVPDGLGAIAAFFTKLGDWATWKRILMVLGGAVLAFLGLFIVNRDLATAIIPQTRALKVAGELVGG